MLQTKLVGISPLFNAAIRKAEQFAKSSWPVLLTGETGVGKERFAQYIHDQSLRREGPFIPVNCAAIPPTLFESELFGHERGAFSGAAMASKGLVRLANRGTLFLDEIGDLDYSLQVKILRLIDCDELRALGGSRVEKVDVRIVAATNVDLWSAIGRGHFRHDLLERLSVLQLPLPALRHRRDDIPMLAGEILRGLEKPVAHCDLLFLKDYAWPGNVRQLRNLLIRATLLQACETLPATIAHLLEEERRICDATRWKYEEPLLEGSLSEIEKRVIVRKLKDHGGNRKKTAEVLGIAKSTLHEKIRRWRLEPDSASWPMCLTSGSASHQR